MSTYLSRYREVILDGRPFRDAQSYGYQTDGGTYIIGSSGTANDDDEDHDLMAITPWYDVYSLWPTAYIEGVAEMLLGIDEPEEETKRPPDRSRGDVSW